MSEKIQRLLQELTDDESSRRELAALLSGEMQRDAPQRRWRQVRPFLAGLSSAAVVVLAFLVPSMQDQWDRFKTRAAIDRYAQVGRDLMQSEHYESAEQAYGRALELAGTQRIDLLEGQLRARIMRIYDSPEWRAAADPSIEEADFVYLLALEKGRERTTERASTTGAYGVYLAGLKRWQDAELQLKEAARLDPRSAAPHIHLGNLYDDLQRTSDAEAQYRQAIALDPREPSARYDLGVLLQATARIDLAALEFAQAVQLAPEDPLSRIAYANALEAQGKTSEARIQALAARKLAPDNTDAAALLQRLDAADRKRPNSGSTN